MNHTQKWCLYCSSPINGKSKYCNYSCKKKYIYANYIKEKKCARCGSIFKGKAGTKYCSSECKAEGLKKVDKVCLICGKSFIGTDKSKYCSSICYNYATSPTTGFKTTTCPVCRLEFRKLRKDERATCSDLCSSKYLDVLLSGVYKNLFGTTNTDLIKQSISSYMQKGELNHWEED